MSKLYIMTGVAIIIALAGTNLIIERRSFETVIVGFIAVAIAGPYLYYSYNRIKHGYHGSREEDALKLAQDELDLQRKVNGKK